MTQNNHIGRQCCVSNLSLYLIIDDCGESGAAAIENSIGRCKKVLSDIGVDVSKIEERCKSHSESKCV
jgi:hypothetical protein